MIELEGISKRYGGVVANDAISLALRTGEVHCLLGENGAGKSTLIGILSGMQQPDAGIIRVDGVPMVMRSPAQARALGLGFVYQRSALVPEFTVGENLLLGRHGLRLQRDALAAEWARSGREFLGDLGLDAPVAGLTLGQRQLLEIWKTLQAGARLLVLDEPTSLLPPQAIEALMERVLQLAESGIGVLFVTHKLQEAYAVAQRVSVLRRGVLTASFEPEADLRATAYAHFEQRVIALMFGEDHAPGTDESDPETATRQLVEAGPRPVNSADATEVLSLLQIEDLCVDDDAHTPALHDCTLSVSPGEILGIAGMEGSGQQLLAEAIAGQRATRSGAVRLADADITALGVAQRQDLGIRYISDDRNGEATLGLWSVARNLLLKRLGQPPFWRLGFARHRAIDAHARALVARLRIATPSVNTPAGTLSGGNLQKLVFARELDGVPRLLVANKPTYGLDLASVVAAHALLRDFARAGGAVVLISNELSELQALSDRVAVMAAGRITRVLDCRVSGFMDTLKAALVR